MNASPGTGSRSHGALPRNGFGTTHTLPSRYATPASARGRTTPLNSVRNGLSISSSREVPVTVMVRCASAVTT